MDKKEIFSIIDRLISTTRKNKIRWKCFLKNDVKVHEWFSGENHGNCTATIIDSESEDNWVISFRVGPIIMFSIEKKDVYYCDKGIELKLAVEEQKYNNVINFLDELNR